MRTVGETKFRGMDDSTALELIQDLEQFTTVNEWMEDEDVLHVLGYVVRLIKNPDVGQLQAPLLVTQLEALSAKFAIMATYYMSMEKGQTARKNMYYTLRDKTKDLADAVKYLAR